MIIKFGIYRTNYSPRFFKHLGDMEEQNENLTLAFNESIDKQDIVELGQNIGDVTIDAVYVVDDVCDGVGSGRVFDGIIFDVEGDFFCCFFIEICIIVIISLIVIIIII